MVGDELAEAEEVVVGFLENVLEADGEDEAVIEMDDEAVIEGVVELVMY